MLKWLSQTVLFLKFHFSFLRFLWFTPYMLLSFLLVSVLQKWVVSCEGFCFFFLLKTHKMYTLFQHEHLILLSMPFFFFSKPFDFRFDFRFSKPFDFYKEEYVQISFLLKLVSWLIELVTWITVKRNSCKNMLRERTPCVLCPHPQAPVSRSG